MIGVANKPGGYDAADERLLSTFAGQVAVAVDNARLDARQRQAIAELRQLRERLTKAERVQLLGRERPGCRASCRSTACGIHTSRT